MTTSQKAARGSTGSSPRTAIVSESRDRAKTLWRLRIRSWEPYSIPQLQPNVPRNLAAALARCTRSRRAPIAGALGEDATLEGDSVFGHSTKAFVIFELWNLFDAFSRARGWFPFSCLFFKILCEADSISFASFEQVASVRRRIDLKLVSVFIYCRAICINSRRRKWPRSVSFVQDDSASGVNGRSDKQLSGIIFTLVGTREARLLSTYGART